MRSIVPGEQYTVDPLSQLKMSWLLRQRLRRVRERQGTGLLLGLGERPRVTLRSGVQK
jgi:hypothetical protein